MFQEVKERGSLVQFIMCRCLAFQQTMYNVISSTDHCLTPPVTWAQDYVQCDIKHLPLHHIASYQAIPTFWGRLGTRLYITRATPHVHVINLTRLPPPPLLLYFPIIIFFPHMQNVDVTLEGLLLRHFKEAYEEKRAQMEAEALRRSRSVTSDWASFPGFPLPDKI